MLPVDNVFLSALRGSVVFDVVVNVYEGTGLIYEGLKIVDGSVTADRESNVRRTLDCTVALHEWEEVSLDVIDTRLQVWMGFNIGGSPTMLPVGVFKVDSIRRVNRGTLSITGTSFESYVIDNKYIGSTDEIMTYPAGSNVVDTIKDIILTSFADASFEIMTSVDDTAVLSADVVMAVEQTYWDAAEILANKFGAEIFCTPTGNFASRSAHGSRTLFLLPGSTKAQTACWSVSGPRYRATRSTTSWSLRTSRVTTSLSRQ